MKNPYLFCFLATQADIFIHTRFIFASAWPSHGSQSPLDWPAAVTSCLTETAGS